jgi:peptidoglycan/xylan/chitin deacetylase (PgdA/CDA1 family)
MKEKKAFPERSAMLTFDDGFMNNYTQAFPLLKEFNIPAAIFLVVDYIGTEKLLWFDELYLLTQYALDIDLSIIKDAVGNYELPDNLADLYPVLSGTLKRKTMEERQSILSDLKSRVKIDFWQAGSNFRLLEWAQVQEMKESGLIDFGIHTANHRIVSELSRDEWEKEIVEPKQKLSQNLDCEISSFCYPNGIPGKDFNGDHEVFLNKAGYICAFSTAESLISQSDNPFCLGRIPAGNDMTSDGDFLPLNTSGFIETLNKIVNRK